MTWMEAVAQLRDFVRQKFEELPSRLFLWTLTATSTEMGDGDQVQTADEKLEDFDGKQKQFQRPVRRIEPWGHRGRPPAKIRQFSLRIGSSNVLTIGIAPTKGYGPTDLKEGETALYSKQVGKGVHLDEDGNNNINAKSGKDTIVNGGTKKVARVDDTVNCGWLLITVDTFTGDVQTIVYTGPDGPMPVPVGPQAVLPLRGKIDSGADNFKG